MPDEATLENGESTTHGSNMDGASNADKGEEQLQEGDKGGGIDSLLGSKAEVQQSGKGEQDVTPQAPEAYTLQIPEGFYTPDQIAVAEKQFRDLGLDNASAQKLVDMSVANQQQAQELHQQQVQRWGDEIRMDKEMGGPAIEATFMEARSALKQFDQDGKVLGLLEKSGYYNHPEVVRMLSRVGKAMGGDGVITGKETSGEKPLHERLYPTN